jgi:hypothetical protein
MLTPSPPNRTTRFPTAQALKLHLDGSTAPPTVNFLQATDSRVVSSLASRPQPNLLAAGTVSIARVVSVPHALRQTIFQRSSFFVKSYNRLQTELTDAISLGDNLDRILWQSTSSVNWKRLEYSRQKLLCPGPVDMGRKELSGAKRVDLTGSLVTEPGNGPKSTLALVKNCMPI